MYSYKERKTAVELYINYGRRAARVIKELGYPNRLTLRLWFYEFQREGIIRKNHKRLGVSPYSEEQQKEAVKHYLQHGRNLNYTVQELGYPGSTHTLSRWINTHAPEKKRICKTGHAPIEYTQEVKEAAVLDFCTRDSSAEAVARRYGVDRCTLYFWKNQLLGEDYEVSRNQFTQDDVDSLKREAVRARVS